MRPHARPLLALLALALLQFWPLVLRPSRTLYSDASDLLAQHLPAKLFLVRSLHETGELPLWNPEQYAGSPFVHDIQVGLFYPLNLPLYILPEAAVGPFLSWQVFAHVLLAGWLMYGYARHAGLGELAAFAAGAGYMLAPRWMMQLFLAGHTVTAGIAWLPLVLLCVERAITGRNWRWAVGGGVAYALLVLGTHPQWTFYGSLLVGLWPLRLLSEQTSRRPFLVRWLAIEAVVVAVGIGLCAVQLLPTLEAAGETSRSRGMALSWSLFGAKAAAGTLVGPFPERTAEGVHWETRGGIGLTWAVLALVGAGLGGRPGRVPVLIAAGMLVYALGGSFLLDRLPGFSTFRMPTRMLLTLAFPVAYLAGLGVQSLAREWSLPALRGATVVTLIVAAGPGLAAALAGQIPNLATANPTWRAYWLAVPVAWLTFLVIAPRQPGPARALTLVAILVGDLLIFSIRFPDTRPTADVYPRSPLLDPIREEVRMPGAAVYDPDVDDSNRCFLGAGSPAASVHGVRSVRGYNPLDVARYRQFLAFVADVGEPQRAFSGNFTNPVMNGFPVHNRRLFDLLGVTWVVAPIDDPPAGAGWVAVRGAVDEDARSYNFLGPGMQNLPPMRLYFNAQSMPRAFVVPEAAPEAAAEAEVLAQLKALDPWQTATLAGWDPATEPLPSGGPGRRWQQVVFASPNRLHVELDGQSAGLLVVTDPWYPGWRCWVDGNEVPIRKAHYAFRGVMVPTGATEVVFRFEPQSYRRGRWVSLAAVGGVVLLSLAALVRRRFRSSTGSRSTGR